MFVPVPRVRAALLGALLALACNKSTPTDTQVDPLVTRDLVIESVQGAPTEAGGQARVGVRLSRAPKGTVTVKLSSSDETEATVTPAELTFTADNWNAPQQVLITGVDDALADGAVPYAIVVTVSSSTDVAFVGASTKRVPLTTTDDETAGATLSAITQATTETGGKSTFTVALDAQPSHDVQVAVTSTDTAEGTVGPVSLTFTPANWKAPQTVTVTGVNDAVADGARVYAVRLAFASTDKAFAALAVREVTLTNTDDDSAGITVGAASGATTEAGTQATVELVLNSEPTGDVTVHFDSSDASEGTVSHKSLTFTAANWNAPQIILVTGVNDDVADGAQPYALAFTATTGADEAYAALTPASVALSNTDDDSAGITVGAASGATSEAGTQATVSMVLNSEPTGDVTVHFDSSDSTEGTLTTRSLTFTPANWRAPQSVLVTGVNDDVADGAQPYVLAFTATTSGDAAYAALTPANVSLSNTDDDSAGFRASALSTRSSEAGAQASFSLALTSEPTADVTVSFDSTDATEGTLATKSLTFTTANWNAPQRVQVTGANDDVADGEQRYEVSFSATQSTDAAYAALTPGDVALSNTDDDSAGIRVSVESSSTSEAGGQARVSLVLESEPTSDVTVSFDSSDTTEGTLTLSSLTFTAANWKTAQSIAVTGVNDDVADGQQPYALRFSATSSDDAAYAAITPANVSLSNTDDDSAGITVSPISGNTTEAGGVATFTVVLASEPTADVTVSFSSDDTSEGTLVQGSLAFTASNWNQAQTVTVTGADDAENDGNVAYRIVFGATVSEDAAYAGRQPEAVSVTNENDDTVPGIEAYFWVLSSHPEESHAAACTRVGRTATANEVPLRWDEAALSALSTRFGFTSKGDFADSANSMWCDVQAGQCGTHNYSEDSYMNYGSYDGYQRGVYTCSLEASIPAYGDWLVGTPCNATDYGGGCTPQETGYHYRGSFDGYQCWWHTKNQAWNTSTATNIYELGRHFGLDPATGRQQWCSSFSDVPTPARYNASYNGASNVGAWGWCGGQPFEYGGWACFKDPSVN